MQNQVRALSRRQNARNSRREIAGKVVGGHRLLARIMEVVVGTEVDVKKVVVDYDVVGMEVDRNRNSGVVEMDVMGVDDLVEGDLLVMVDYFHYKSVMNDGDLVVVEKEDYIPRLVEGHWRPAGGEGRHLSLIVEEVGKVKVFDSDSGFDLVVGYYLRLAYSRSFARPNVVVRVLISAGPMLCFLRTRLVVVVVVVGGMSIEYTCSGSA